PPWCALLPCTTLFRSGGARPAAARLWPVIPSRPARRPSACASYLLPVIRPAPAACPSRFATDQQLEYLAAADPLVSPVSVLPLRSEEHTSELQSRENL